MQAIESGGQAPELHREASAFIEALYDFSRVARACNAQDAQGFTRLQVALLTKLHRGGPCRMTSLTEALDVDLSVTSRQVAQLVDDGLVEQQRDPVDRRALLTSITPAGIAELERVTVRRAQWWNRTLSVWTPEQLNLAAQVVRATAAAAMARRQPAPDLRGNDEGHDDND